MDKNRSLIFIVALSILAILSCGSNNAHQDIEMLENNKAYTVWEVLHTFSDTGESDTLIPDVELIESLPDAVKAIIAHYSTYIPDYMWKKDSRSAFVAALGKYSSLTQAQKQLLKKYNISNLVTAFYKGTPNVLKLKETDGAIFFTCHRGWQNTVTDEFRISKSGVITYVEKEEPADPIRYDRELILDRYYDTHTIKLNGEKIDLRYTYLDHGNIESASINERDKVIYIEQKNKNPEYFSPSSIDISQLSFTVKSIDEVTLIIAEDGFGKQSIYDSKRTKIEQGAIRAVANSMTSTDGVKYMTIILLF